MSTVATSNRSDTMSGYPLDWNNNSRMQSPSSEYSYAPALSSSSSGIFPFSQTGPSADPSGSVWDTTTVEGPQNFFADQGDSEEYTFTIGHYPRSSQMDAPDDFQSTWLPAAAAAVGDKTHKAEPMRRITSKGSASGHRITKVSSNKSQQRLSTAVSRTLQASSFDMTGNATALSEGPLGNSRAMDPSHFLYQQSSSLATSPELLYSQLDGMPSTGIAFDDFIATQHVEPSAISLDFETSMSGGSPTESWDNLSEGTTPSKDDSWPLAIHNSPITSVASSSPTIQCLDNLSLATQSMMTSGDLESSTATILGDDQASVNGWANRRLVNDGESARDHPLYKSAFPQADGLYHCPWEGETSCNHKPEKLKCNYDKFVDSHLKPYRCKVDSCENARFSSTACLLRHEREAHAMHGHGDKPYLCTYEGCDRAVPGNGFPRNWNLRDHMRRVHNDDGKSLNARSGPPSPGGNPQKALAKSRKRKSDPTGKGSIGRKSPKSPKSSPVVDVELKVDMSAKLQEDFYATQAGLSDIFSRFPQPNDPMVLDHITRAKETLDTMARIHMDIMAAKNNDMSQQQYLAFVQQSG